MVYHTSATNLTFIQNMSFHTTLKISVLLIITIKIITFHTVSAGPSWGTWVRWSICTKACDGGYRHRSQICTTEDNEECIGHIFETEECNTHACEGIRGKLYLDKLTKI